MQEEQKQRNKMLEMLTELIPEDLAELSDSDVTLIAEKAAKIITAAQVEKMVRKSHQAISDYHEKSGKAKLVPVH